MATLQIPKRVCDRCGATVTDKGGRFALWSLTTGECHPMAVEGTPPEPGDEVGEMRWRCSVDLCRVCAGSLQGWWTAPVRRGQDGAA